MNRWLVPTLLWAAVAILVTWPVVLHPSAVLLGDARIDVWNHAWGFWYVAEALAAGTWPTWTPLAGGPAGGALYFIDTPGAVLWAPVTWLAGPAVAYNFALMTRVFLSGVAGQLLYEEIEGRDAGRWIAGLACATLPFLLCELNNGISEVASLHWVAGSLLAAARVGRRGKLQDWALLGLMGGLAAAWSFYQGLTAGLAVAVYLLLRQGQLLFRERRLLPGALSGVPLAAVIGAAFAAPVWLVFKASLEAPDALIQRSLSLHVALLEHNAVDPRIYFMPGHFQSVDLLAIYGEPFLHTAYLRLTVVLLALLAVIWRPRLRIWAGVCLSSLFLGLGTYLWWGESFVTFARGWKLSMPFGWLVDLLPQIAITHPLRLSLPGQIVACVLAGQGAIWVMSRFNNARWPGLLFGGLLVFESFWGSLAVWPISTSPSAVPQALAQLRETQGMVLNLPVEVGTSMLTSRYFWWQTLHERPIPFVPDVRLGSAKDPFVHNWNGVMEETPRPLTGRLKRKLLERYGAVVLHQEWSEQAGTLAYERILREGLGEPIEQDGLLIWILPGDKVLTNLDDSDLGPGSSQPQAGGAPPPPPQ